KCVIVTDMRDLIELLPPAEQPRYFEIIIPTFISVLSSTQPVFTNASHEHFQLILHQKKLRNAVLEVIHRLQTNHALLPFAVQLMDIIMAILRSDNEDNGAICLKILVELHKNFRSVLEDHVQLFFELVKDMYQSMDSVVKEIFDVETIGQTPVTTPISPAPDDSAPKNLARSTKSFKVLTECPIILAMLFQVYKRFVPTHIPEFVPITIGALSLQPEAQRRSHEEATRDGRIFIGVSPYIPHRLRVQYSELKALQVKTLSFIAYILRSFTALLKPYENQIATCVVDLLKDCPPEACQTRKAGHNRFRDILVATRHIGYTEFRAPFVQYMDVLLNEEVIIGTGLTGRDGIRSLGHSVLVDLIHHVRMELTPTQVSRAIHLYSRNLHDPTLAPGIHTVCAKLLFNLMDRIMPMHATEEKETVSEGRILLLRIFTAIATKFPSLSSTLPMIIRTHYRRKTQAGQPPTLEKKGNEYEFDGFLDLGVVQPIRTTGKALEQSADVIKDVRFLFKNMVGGIKNILGNMISFNPPPPANFDGAEWNRVARGFSEEENKIFVTILIHGLKCFDLLYVENFNPDGSRIPISDKGAASNGASVVTKEEKELYEGFGLIFHYVEPSIFQEVFSSQMEYFIEQILQNNALIGIAQYFLNNPAVSASFTGLLLRYLVDKMEVLGGVDTVRANVLLRLFKLVFHAVGSLPKENELVLRPHVAHIILTSLKLSAKAVEPMNYFVVLRALFRSIGGGRFELLYGEVFPLLQLLLESLNALLASAHKPQMREIFCELCLTVPVRLSVLLPYLSYLMKPVVHALHSGPELVLQGLRTLEVCIENLTQEFLEPILAPVLCDLMAALWKHLKPLPYDPKISHNTMRILGKLGGRNRRLLRDPPLLSYQANIEAGLDLEIPVSGASLLSLDACLNVAVCIVNEPTSGVAKCREALNFLYAALPLLIHPGCEYENARVPRGVIRRMREKIRAQVAERERVTEESQSRNMTPNPSVAIGVGAVASQDDEAQIFVDALPFTHEWKEAHDKALGKVIEGLFATALLAELRDESWRTIEDLCCHFAIFCTAETAKGKVQSRSDAILFSWGTNGEGFINGVVEAMTCEWAERRALGQRALRYFHSCCRAILGSDVLVQELSVFRIFMSRFCSTCYRSESFRKIGGCLGIRLICSELGMGQKWLLEHEHECARALLYVLKDSGTSELMDENTDDASETLLFLLRVCNEPLEPIRVQRFNGLVSLLVVELNNCNANVRLAVQKASKLLAELHGITITDLLNPVKARMLGPIFAKPLRALPFSNQIGNIDAITYSLSLQPALVQFNDELLRLLHEALALADADDQALVSKNSQFKNQTSLTQLRVVCIKLLSAAMTTPEFFSQKQPTQQATRSRIISMFFKSLYSKSPEIVEEANKGLQRVLSTQSKLPKDLLQQGLRPILVKLSDHKLLSVSGLEGLARLMELLTNYFKPEIGKKLLDHLRQWADPNMLEEAAGRLLSDIEDIKIIVAIIDVFYLLPAAASTFMDELVREVVKLESKLKRSISSPFRTPLVRFLTRYPAESIEYFTGKLGDVEGVPFVRLLVDLLEFADGLRIEMKQRLGGMLDHLLTDNDSPNVTWIISIVHVLARDDREWLRSDVVVFERMWNLWKAKLDQMSTIDLSVIGLSPPTNDSQRLIEILIWYSSSEPINADVVFDIVRGINHPDVIDPGFIKQFLFENVGKNLSATNKRLVIERFLAIFHDFKIPQETKAQILKLVITPMLLLAVEQGTHHLIVDSKLVEMVHLRVWHPMLGDHADVLVSDEGLRLELLQLTTLLVQYFPEAISESRKDVIKFAWGSLKTEEVTCKQAAYVLLCRFVAAFETPNKLIMQMLGKLFTFQMGDTKMLVRQALDILVPVLPERTAVAGKDVRTGSTGPGASTPAAPNKPMWVRWFRRALVEDGQNSMQMIPIFQCLVNHSNVFYEYRDQFISHIITSLHRLPAMSSSSSTGSSMSSVPEWKTLTVELGELILSWETRQATEASAMVKSDNVEDRLEPPAKRAMLESPDGTTYADTQTPFRERLVSYVVRFAISTHEPQTKRLVERSIDLVRSFLELWPELNIEMDAFERVITMEVNEGTIPTISSSIDILRVIGAAKSNEWVVANCGIIQRFVSKWIESEDSRMSKTVVPICDRVMGAAAAVPLANFSQEIQMDIKGFTDMVEAVAKAGLSEPARLYTSVLLLECINLHRPQSSESLIVMLELIKRLANEYLHPEEQIPQHDAAYNELLPPMLIKLMNMSKNRVAAMNDHRRGYLAVVAVLIEEANDVELLECLATLVRGWIFSKHEAFPTIKEKANVMLKMVTFDRLKEKRLLEEYLILVADVYSDPGFHRTELAVRLENAFLMGLAAENPHLRDRFSQLLDRSLSPVVGLRLNYLIGVQNWEPLADSFWLRQATNLLIGSIVPTETLHSTAKGYRVTAVTLDTQNGMDENLASECDVVEEPEKDVDDILARHGEFLQHLQTQGIPSLLQPIKSMMYSDTSLTYRVWVNMFPVCWSVLNADERHQIVNKSIIPLLAKDYHKKQLDSSLNVIQALLEGIANCVPAIKLPPQLVKYLGRSYNSWHVALELISAASGPDRHVATPQSKEDEKITQMTLDALADVYVSLGENDYFFGLWRRRSLYQETNAGISYAQTGMWAQAQTMFENAQAKARTGALPFSEAEYSLWESQWISCAQRLQQWDVLTDLAKHDGNTELLVECAWRIGDWEAERESLISSLASVSEVPTPRKKVFEAFLALGSGSDTNFEKAVHDGIQLSLKRWIALPTYVMNAHIPLLHFFQQFLELTEAATIRANVIVTDHSNVETKQTELKNILQTWRDRLPNSWDDINIWSDLVAWRQHIFAIINKAYLPMIKMISQQAPNNPNSSFAYRGYHETAWIINRFAHIARKHQLPEVCSNMLSNIYKLPNIEIQEAFFKLREQAKSHFQNPNEYAHGLDVINNTNLMYFTNAQKAEFFSLKGRFLAKLDIHQEAFKQLSSAVQVEMTLPKAWAALARYYDRMFKEQPTDFTNGANAINAYLNAAGLTNHARCRKYIARILFLLSMDYKDQISNSYEKYRGEVPQWYWVTFIPQLLTSLASKEAKFARAILMKMAKNYPQALHFSLRTARAELEILKRHMQMQMIQARAEISSNSRNPISPAGLAAASAAAQAPSQRSHPLMHVEEVMSLVKTAFPLLALSLETMADQLTERFKPLPDEDIYRLIVALLADGILQLDRQSPENMHNQLSQATEQNLLRFAQSMSNNHRRYKASFEREFIKPKPTLFQLVEKFREWRDKLEILLDRRPRRQNLEHFSHYLVEFEYQKFDEIEIPGQYSLVSTSQKDFIRIDRFLQPVDLVRGYGNRRITMKGHDGSLHPFVIHHPSVRVCRREEKVMQLFRILNTVLDRKKESRRRNLFFHLPVIVPLAPNVRLIQDDPSYVTLQEMYEDFCRRSGLNKDEPTTYHLTRMREIIASEEMPRRSQNRTDIANAKAEILQTIQEKMIPPTILSQFIARRMESYSDLWVFRKQFSGQLAAVTFLTHTMCIGQRLPQKFNISCRTGNIWASEVVPFLLATGFLFQNKESVPFRLTPNLSHFITETGMEGPFASSILAIARSVTEPEYDLEDFLSLFVRDELVAWQQGSRKPATLTEQQTRELIAQNVNVLLQRAQGLSCRTEPNQTILDLIANATNPLKLAQMELAFLAAL
ncbi:hypothetical protein BJ742DRAFT_680099, partial [Cladochytrium replicatum]